MNILVSCDDGIAAEGFAALAAEAARLGTVRAAATERPASGIGHAVTLHRPVACWPAEVPGAERAVAVRGTPADAVKLALAELWPGWAGLVLSGINAGPNVGVNAFYSGTVGAAAEAAVAGVPAVALSLDVSAPYDFPAAAERARPVLERLAALAPWTPGLLFNVNLPASGRPVRGIRLTRHGRSGFREFYRSCACPEGDSTSSSPEALSLSKGGAPDGACFYSVDGNMEIHDPDDWTDAAALAAGHVSVTPMFLDLTVEPLRRREPEQAGAVAATLARLDDWRQP
ncbi:MAG TPA: 5'/3'-nucleotidase SurE [Planctomycetota bacterium]|nr:5'/3'-nucleotidase SurE [Planctomycetota bacterium]